MFSSEIQVRVRYAETDQMGFVYYGNYATYFEVARVESLRDLGFSYKVLEEEGILLPVLEFSIKYFKPAYYDDLLTIRTVIPEIPMARIHFEYETYNEQDVLINRAKTSLVFINRLTQKPCPAPENLRTILSRFF